MTRTKNNGAPDGDVMLDDNARDFKITFGEIKDEFCNYGLEYTSGKKIGFKEPKSIGVGIVDDDMLKAAKKLRVHLAVFDDVFLVAGIEVKNIDKFHKHELTSKYVVTGFKITGDEEAESVELFGSKLVKVGHRMGLVTGKIAIDNASSYPHHNELREAVLAWREEVALYHEGKFTQVEKEEEKKPLKQTKIQFQNPEGAAPPDLNE